MKPIHEKNEVESSFLQSSGCGSGERQRSPILPRETGAVTPLEATQVPAPEATQVPLRVCALERRLLRRRSAETQTSDARPVQHQGQRSARAAPDSHDNARAPQKTHFSARSKRLRCVRREPRRRASLRHGGVSASSVGHRRAAPVTDGQQRPPPERRVTPRLWGKTPRAYLLVRRSARSHVPRFTLLCGCGGVRADGRRYVSTSAMLSSPSGGRGAAVRHIRAADRSE